MVRIAEDETGRRFERFKEEHKDEIYDLRDPGHIVFEGSLFSYRYANCCGVALLHHHLAGLTHYWRDAQLNPLPEEYMLDFLSRFTLVVGTSGLSTLKAAVIGGDREHFETLKDILRDARIPVVGEYCDEWGDDNNIHWKQLRLPQS